jgi:hypothetical protein
MIDLATENLKQMTMTRGVDRNVRWSPDGKSLAYTSSAVDKSDARIMFCETATGKITPLRFDESVVRREIERPFLAGLKEPATPPGRSPLPEDSQMDEILERMGEKMLPTIKRATPAVAKSVLGKYKQWQIDRIHPITARYLDWK